MYNITHILNRCWIETLARTIAIVKFSREQHYLSRSFRGSSRSWNFSIIDTTGDEDDFLKSCCLCSAVREDLIWHEKTLDYLEKRLLSHRGEDKVDGWKGTREREREGGGKRDTNSRSAGHNTHPMRSHSLGRSTGVRRKLRTRVWWARAWSICWTAAARASASLFYTAKTLPRAARTTGGILWHNLWVK